ncbi:Utp21-domain-containing protein [Xylona heveae TC161]|uniref:Utp21-domain-containing protein n=1 Tax=Xylona heveae (strain CBS 132557 / TC161) TaxID=1328760 RepID=A0A165FN97_XYLHT|nr:Utp21-domain-containing protein [Xylona heveae TC161]KZF21183.1 Utp21-domain-containing protein [Xylona heveae TC161]
MPTAVPVDDHGGPLTKRRKTAVVQKAPKSQTSRIFAPYRTIGLVSPTQVPFTSIGLGKTTFQITTSVGRSLQTYDLRRGLNLVFLSRPQTPEEITATIAWKGFVLAAWGAAKPGSPVGVWIFQRGKKVNELELPADLKEPIQQLLVFGSWIVGYGSTRIEIWKSATYEHYTTLFPLGGSTTGAVPVLSGGMCTMPTYLNKIFIGRQDGGVEIWNLNTGRLIYTILPESSDSGAVTALQPAPVLSLLAIAYANGTVVIKDVRLDRDILKFNQGSSTKTPISSITFRTDGQGAGEDGRMAGVMATAGSGNGDVTLWDLNDGGRIMGVLRGAHNPPSAVHGGVSGGISKVEFLQGQPVMVTSGLDNSLKSWIFDETPFSPIPRILHSRTGHAAPVTRLEFLPSDFDGAESGGKWLLSSGRDRSLWGWSLRKDGQSTELSQGKIRSKARKLGILGAAAGAKDSSASLEDLKASEISCMACSLSRDGGMGAAASSGVWTNVNSAKKGDVLDSAVTGWESVVTGHKGDKFARTWFWGRKKAGRWAFESGDGTEVKSVAISPCGTFALVGSAGGALDMFNLQSGQRRQRFPAPLTPAQAKKIKMQQAGSELSVASLADGFKKFGPGQGKHTKAVTGIMVDSLNKTVISSGLDGKIKFWDFATGTLQDEIDWYPMSAITGARHHRPSDLIALSCDDLSIRVVDIETKKLVRELWGCVGQISDFCFSNDGRWIVAASMDSVVRVWDLPTGHLIDAVRLRSACTALAFSNTGEFLATAHADGVGVNIWNNRSLFTHVSTRHLSEEEIAEIDAPTASGEGGQNIIDAAFDEDEPEDGSGLDTAISTIDQLSKDITTLSIVPKSRWQTLLHLDAIKQRNKPKEAPKAPEKAPFFLPSTSTGDDKPSAISTTTTSAAGGAAPAGANTITAAERSRIAKMAPGASESRFTSLLRSGAQSGNYDPFINHLKTLPPAAADIELRSLNPLSASALAPSSEEEDDDEDDEDDGRRRGGRSELTTFITALTSRLRQKRDYELVQAWMAVFLRVHGDSVAAADEAGARAALLEWRAEQQSEERRLGGLVGFCSGVVGFMRSARV